jgi:hypothetical protein
LLFELFSMLFLLLVRWGRSLFFLLLGLSSILLLLGELFLPLTLLQLALLRWLLL